MSSRSNTSSEGTLASASSTFIWPGMRPATGWIAYLTLTPCSFSRSPISRSACCAWATRSEEHTSELQSLMRISYAVFCLKQKNNHTNYVVHILRPHHNHTGHIRNILHI